MQYSSADDATGRMVLRKKSFKASPLVMGFASFKIVCIFIISDVSAKAQGKTQIAAKSLSQGSFQIHIPLSCRRLPGRGQELLHVPAHGGEFLIDSTDGNNSVQIRKHWGRSGSEWEWVCFGRPTS